MASRIFSRVCRFAMAIAVAAVFGGPANAGYVSFDPPGSRLTTPFSINDAGAIVGWWFDGSLYHGFLRSPKGIITSFDPTGSVATTPIHINENGIVVGTYKEIYSGYPFYHGFIRAADGTITTYDPPDYGGSTTIEANNKANTFTGYYTNSTGGYHGFVLNAAGHFVSFDPRGSVDTLPRAINDSGTITGYFYDANAIAFGFVRAPGGKITTFEVHTGAYPSGIDAQDEITGNYTDSVFHVHGFLLEPTGLGRLFDYPGINSGTYPQGINNGAIVGFYYDQANNVHGFERDPAGAFSMIQPEGAAVTNSQAAAINKKGEIAGWYATIPRKGQHGFFYKP
jgi:hypothetical protein